MLDYLLEDERIDIEGISGTSAGAMNAVMLADGLARGGPAEARKRLDAFWRAASLDGNLPALQRSVMDRLFSFTPYEGSPVQAWFNAVARYMSPYDLNPLNINPLRDLIERFVDFDAVRACKDVSLFISATNVHTGRLRVFPQEKITADVIMASACLPFLFRAVEIDGVPYWDGGYMGNPAIFPFFGATHDRGRAGGADQSGRAQGDAAHADRDHEPHQRDHVQFLAARRVSRDRFRHAADRPGQAAARHRRRAIPPHQRAPHRARLDVQGADRRARSSIRISISSRC